MHLDWINENGHIRNKQRNFESRRLIRRRAIQAAVLTKEQQKGELVQSEPQLQRVHTWVVASAPDHTSVFRPTIDADLSASRSGITVLPIDNDARPMQGPWYSISSLTAVPYHLAYILQSTSFAPAILQILENRLPTPDKQVQHFIVLALEDTDYLHAIGSLYGKSECLDAAIECLAACLQHYVLKDLESVRTKQLYGRALVALQKAITTAVIPKRYEIYYAIPLLVLFELLDPADRLAYLRHGRGAVHMLHFIGPGGMETMLDKTLLAMQSDLMIAENLRDGHTHCCDDLKWHQALRKTIDHELLPGALCSEANITLNIIATALPDTLTEVEQVVKNLTRFTNANLKSRLQTTMDRLENWSCRWHPLLRVPTDELTGVSERKVLLAISLMYVAISNRLTVATSSSQELAINLERQAYRAATEALAIARDTTSIGMIGRTRLALTANFVRAVAETSEE